MNEAVANNGNQMIGVSVTRNEKNQLKDYYQSKANYAASDDFEQKLDNGVNIAKGTVAILGATATVVLLICPVDGPVGEIITGLATPGLIVAVDKLGDSLKDMYKSSKKVYSGSVNSNTGKVEMGRVISDETLTNVNKLTTAMVNARRSSDELKNMVNDTKAAVTAAAQNTATK